MPNNEECKHDWRQDKTSSGFINCAKCGLMEKLTQAKPNNEDWFKKELDIYWNEHDGTNFYKDELKNFILECKSRWVGEERMKIINLLKFKKVLEVSLPSDTERVLLWKQRHNKTLDEVIEFLTTPNKDI